MTTDDPFLIADDFESLLAIAKKKVDESNRVPDELPVDSNERLKIHSVLEKDVRAWGSLLFSLLQAISFEKQVFERGLPLTTSRPDLDFRAISNIELAFYGNYLTLDEIRQILGAVSRTWDLMKESREFEGRFDVGWRRITRAMYEEPLPKRMPKKVRAFANQIRSLPIPQQIRLSNLTGHLVVRCFGLTQLRSLLTVIRDLYSATDKLKARLAKSLNLSPDVPSQFPSEEDEIRKHASKVLKAQEIDPAKVAELTDTQCMYCVWLESQSEGLTGAKIRDKWNEMYPLRQVSRGKVGSAHVRSGIRDIKKKLDKLR